MTDERTNKSNELSNAERSRQTTKQPITAIAENFGFSSADIDPYGSYKAKVRYEAIEQYTPTDPSGNLVLVTAVTPTPMGEGKTVTTIGLGDAFTELGHKCAIAIRQPSLGPIFGKKGGATGGGNAQVIPMEEINLHFTGDIHAITAAHNLIAASLDNHIFQQNSLGIDPSRVVWPRAVDINDRGLRHLISGIGEKNGPLREAGFIITAASEIMAVIGMATSIPDLKQRIGRIVVAYDSNGNPIVVDDLDITGAVCAVLRDALRPNVVQTMGGTLAFIHGGPFANIAHGTNTILADKIGLAMGEYLITEGGFGADLGAEKFFDIVSHHGIVPSAVVLVVTVRALRTHGEALTPSDADSRTELEAGFVNLDHHVSILEQFGYTPVVAINRFPEDTDPELQTIQSHCSSLGVESAVSTVFQDGGAGGTQLAKLVKKTAMTGPESFKPVYDPALGVKEKIHRIATEVYGATDVTYTETAEADIEQLTKNGYSELPVCISKVPTSITDDPEIKGVPSDWLLTVREVYPAAGPGFVVALTGDVLTMPGLPETPAAERINLSPEGHITGL